MREPSHTRIRQQVAHVDGGKAYTVSAIARVAGRETWIMREKDTNGESLRFDPFDLCPHGAIACEECKARVTERKRQENERRVMRESVIDKLHEEALRENRGKP